jgi:hypothetical protein
MIVFSFQEVSNISGYFENVVFPLDSSVPPSQFSADVSGNVLKQFISFCLMFQIITACINM